VRAPLAKIQNFGTLYLRNPVLFGAKNFTEFFLSIDLLYNKNLGRLEHFYAKVFDLAWFIPYGKNADFPTNFTKKILKNQVCILKQFSV